MILEAGTGELTTKGTHQTMGTLSLHATSPFTNSVTL